MTITEIRPVTKTKYRIDIDGQFAFVLYKGELSRFHIREGGEISAETFREIRQEVLIKRARARCNHLLTDVDKTESQIRQSLEKSMYPADVIDETVAFLKDHRYIDDRRYAENYVSLRKDKKSGEAIRIDLMRRGIDRSIIDEALGGLDESDQMDSLFHLIGKKWKSSYAPDYQEMQKLKGFLLRKGYSYSMIEHACRDYFADYPERVLDF